MQKTLVAWHRFGKELDENNFRCNPPELIEQYLHDKVAQFKKTPADKWMWFQVSDELIIEKTGKTHPGTNAATIIYYLPQHLCSIQENVHFSSLGPEWTWYIHLGSTTYHPDLDAWIFKDLFADILIQADNKTHSVLDLDDLAHVYELGLIDQTELSEILRRTQALVDLIRNGDFPPQELAGRAELLAQLSS